MKKYNILFASSLSQEIASIKEEIKKLDFKNLNIKYLNIGVGNYNAIYNISNYLKENKVDFLVNIGVCGKSNEKEENSFFQVSRILLASNKKEIIPPIYFKFLNLKSILSSEKIITNFYEMIGENFVDMESYAIDFISTKEKIPFVILKKPFDFVSENSKKINLIDLKNSLKGLAYRKLLENIENYLEKNKKINKLDYEFYKKYFSLSFAETEIFKKLVNKYEAITKKDFKNFFDENKFLGKKIFFDKIDNF